MPLSFYLFASIILSLCLYHSISLPLSFYLFASFILSLSSIILSLWLYHYISLSLLFYLFASIILSLCLYHSSSLALTLYLYADVLFYLSISPCMSLPLLNKGQKSYVAMQLNKRDFAIEKQIACYFVRYSTCLSNPIPFYVIQIINPFLDSIISANYEKIGKVQPICRNPYTPYCFSSVDSLLVEPLTSPLWCRDEFYQFQCQLRTLYSHQD